MSMKRLAVAANHTLLIGSAALFVAGCTQNSATGADKSVAGTAAADTNVVDAGANLRVPNDYRSTYQTLGTWAIAADSGKGSKEMHIVYASPGAADAYRKTKQFPDGTVLVKEVYQTATSDMTTGTVSHPDKLKGWFVMVKDSRNSHPGKPLWGDGWGWSWFDAGNPTHTTSTDYKNDCQSCHVPAQATDWIYVNGYPVLKQ
ncbi:cytochrome P460 family protein [Sphingomonas sp. PR090111-T3T-6A]|uniref:cytochrome P460 family protein n=1 Tax=Sphingomonas sp. PR090111-T3T-6A TaxID=685778 RepID=UPI00037416A6|nr:cytochrome P460 family protein [Sphingomonas sp. PR090111-T3T-6A]